MDILKSWISPGNESGTEVSEFSWIKLDHRTQVKDLLDISQQRPIIIFKHSTRCGISAAVKAHLAKEWNFSQKELPFYYLDLITYRALSNEIAETLNIWHQSPQIILIYKGEVVFHTSHHAIDIHKIQTEFDKIG